MMAAARDADAAPALVIQHVTYRYEGPAGRPIVALDDVTIDVPAGQFVLIAGATGSGKSTLLQHLNGLLFPSEGEVRVGDIVIGPRGPNVPRRERAAVLRRLRTRVGLSFQYPEHQLFASTVAEDVAFGPRALGLTAQEVQARVEQALTWLNLQELADRTPFALSGGQMRRVALAGVLAMQPEILALDEPLAGLDAAGRTALLQGLARWRESSGGTLIMISHQLEELAALADRVIVLHRGRLVADAAPRELFARPELADWGLEEPELVQVLAGLRQAGWPVPAVALTVEEAARVIEEVRRSCSAN